jgi:DNA-binding winged helix-turn-helix (wHTH) protein
MAETQSRPRLVRFGAFEADVQTGELRKDGVKLKFSGQPFQVLAILLERPGDVVTREELQMRLWLDTFVDVERNLNTAVNKIREILGDSAESPRFIETLSRRGYRFIGALEPPVQPEVPVEPIRTSSSPQTWLKIAGGIFPCRWSRRHVSMVPACASDGEQDPDRTIECCPVYGIAGRRDFPRFLSRWIPNRLRLEW